jgi:hypothetical protein
MKEEIVILVVLVWHKIPVIISILKISLDVFKTYVDYKNKNKNEKNTK